MFGNRLLRLTFTVSLLFHGVILLPRPHFNPFTPAPKLQKIAVRYVKENLSVKSLPKNLTAVERSKAISPAEPLLAVDAQSIGATVRRPLPYFEPDSSFARSDSLKAPVKPKLIFDNQGYKPQGFSKPNFINSQALAIKKKIALPAIESAKIDNPSYISYYQIVREKIRRSAYQNYTHNQTGEVYLSFIISNDGLIKDVRLAEDRTSVDSYLKNIALKSIRDASPFPNFPKELDYPQLSFNIIISFEIE
jgi:TonB family protein